MTAYSSIFPEKKLLPVEEAMKIKKILWSRFCLKEWKFQSWRKSTLTFFFTISHMPSAFAVELSFKGHWINF